MFIYQRVCSIHFAWSIPISLGSTGRGWSLAGACRLSAVPAAAAALLQAVDFGRLWTRGAGWTHGGLIPSGKLT